MGGEATAIKAHRVSDAVIFVFKNFIWLNPIYIFFCSVVHFACNLIHLNEKNVFETWQQQWQKKKNNLIGHSLMKRWEKKHKRMKSKICCHIYVSWIVWNEIGQLGKNAENSLSVRLNLAKIYFFQFNE